jgi:hypothetical protein
MATRRTVWGCLWRTLSIIGILKVLSSILSTQQCRVVSKSNRQENHQILILL